VLEVRRFLGIRHAVRLIGRTSLNSLHDYAVVCAKLNVTFRSNDACSKIGRLRIRRAVAQPVGGNMYYTMRDMSGRDMSGRDVSGRDMEPSSPINTKPETSTTLKSTTLKSTMSGTALREFLERLIGLLEQSQTA